MIMANIRNLVFLIFLIRKLILMIFIQKKIAFFTLLLTCAGATLHPVTTKEAYSRLSKLTFSEDFDVLNEKTALKTALYLNATPQETKKCAALMNAFNQQVKYRPDVVKALKKHNVIVDEATFITSYAKGIASWFVTTLVQNIIANSQNIFTKKIGIKIINSAIVSPIFDYFFWTLFFKSNPNAYRVVNLSAPTRYQTFSHQMIDSVAQGIINGIVNRIGNTQAVIGLIPDEEELSKDALFLIKIAISPLIMNWYVNWSRTNALAELAKLEQALPANLVAEVNELIKN